MSPPRLAEIQPGSLWEVLIRQVRQHFDPDDTVKKALKMNREPGDKRTRTFTGGIVSEALFDRPAE